MSNGNGLPGVSKLADPAFWVSAIKEVGFPIVAYGGLAYALWSWGNRQQDRDDKLANATAATLAAQQDTQDKIAAILTKLSATQETLAVNQSKAIELLEGRNVMEKAE